MDTGHFFHVFADLAENIDAKRYNEVPGWVPEVYDMVESDTEELDFILGYAKKVGGPVLEPACGTGRLLIPLAREGFEITGDDINQQMLTGLNRHLEAEPMEVKDMVTVVRGDMQTFKLDSTFNFAFLSVNALLYIWTAQGQQETISNIYRHLNPGGTLLVDVYLPKPNPCAEEPYMRTAKSKDGRNFMFYLAQARDDFFTQVSHVNSVTYLYEEGQLKQTFMDSWRQRWIYPNELELMLSCAGFTVVDMLGDYNGKPLDEFSGQMVAVARK
jgi:SAM-dependent methyltransferase